MLETGEMGGVLVCVLAGVFIVAPTASPNPTSLLSRINKAQQFVSYEGKKISKTHCGMNCVTAVLKVEHLKPAYTRTVFLQPDRLVGTIILRRNDTSWRFSPSINGWIQIADSSHRDYKGENVVFGNYSISIMGEASIANRKTIVLQALPRSSEDLSKRIWVDKEHFIIIKQEAFTKDGRIVNSSQYTNITFNPKLDQKHFDLPKNTIKSSKPVDHFKTFYPVYLPKGYLKVAKGEVVAGGHMCYHMYFSNGVSGISLFQRPLAKGELLRKIKSTQGANIVSWHQNGMGFVLVGDVSIRELERIAASLKP
jgi:negative regulator of sigma E activity